MPLPSRPMTPAEKYYAFLDETWPMNIMLVAELDRCFTTDDVENAWQHYTKRRSFTRLAATQDLRITETDPALVDFASHEVSGSCWPLLADEAVVPYGLDHPVRLRYLHDGRAGRSWMALSGHHAIVDGRVGIGELQGFLRSLDGQPVPEQQGLSMATPMRESHPWQGDRSALVRLLRDIAERNQLLGEPDPADWPDPGIERRVRMAPVNLEPEESAQVIAASRRHGVSVLAVMAAAWLLTFARYSLSARHATLQLLTPTDLAAPSTDPDRPTATAVGVLATRYRVDPGKPWSLATQVRSAVSGAMSRGEGDLFFHLARARHVDDLRQGAEVVARSVRTAPPGLSATNLGIVNAEDDPSWVRWMCGYLAPTPNQIGFVSGLGYRGQLINSLSTDDMRTDAAVARVLPTRFREVLDQMVTG